MIDKQQFSESKKKKKFYCHSVVTEFPLQQKS